ncbi:hypothetical protein ACGF0K_36530 [Streptomyces sp. NPDC048156]|uniref:hypothetical protein n=1 Tax=Streptomyces sp. NPDC048156 TaxID=3365502 RepID=UPI0037182EF5
MRLKTVEVDVFAFAGFINPDAAPSAPCRLTGGGNSSGLMSTARMMSIGADTPQPSSLGAASARFWHRSWRLGVLLEQDHLAE